MTAPVTLRPLLTALSLGLALALGGCGAGGDGAVVGKDGRAASAAQASRDDRAPSDDGQGPARTQDEAGDQGSTEVEDPGDGPTSEEETEIWTSKAAARCERYQSAAQSVRKKWEAKAETADELVEGALRDGMVLVDDLVEDLRAIEVPADAQGSWSDFIDGYAILAEEYPDHAPDIVRGRETKAMRTLMGRVARKQLPAMGEFDLGPCEQIQTG